MMHTFASMTCCDFCELPLQAVVDQLKGLLDQDLSFMAAVLDCIGNMQLEQHLQVGELLALVQE